jgi:predicted small secreted protein
MSTFTTSVRRALILFVGASIAIGALGACNTISGAGKDIKSTGKAIEKTADDNN